MRLGLPLMLIASLVLHLGVAIGLVVHWHGSHAPAGISTSIQDKAPSLILLSSIETPDFRQSVAPQRHTSSPVASNTPVALPTQPPAQKHASVVVVTAPSFALEANPNAHVRALPPEEVLNPTAAPHLDGKGGIVFILDISGSMYEPYQGSTRLALARQVLNRRIQALKDGTPFAITLYAERAINSGPLVAASHATREAASRFIMQDMDCGGGTSLSDGLVSAQKLEAGNLVLVSDGDLNINTTELLGKARDILGPQGNGPNLTIIGIYPRATKNDAHVLQSLADLQGGSYCTQQQDADWVTSNQAASAAKH